MGLFSFLSGGKKKEKTAPADSRVKPPPPSGAVQRSETSVLKSPAAEMRGSDGPPAPAPTGLRQAKLRLKLRASLRTGAHFEAYEAARGLAAIQAEAGRRVGARVWSREAERIKARLPA